MIHPIRHSRNPARYGISIIVLPPWILACWLQDLRLNGSSKCPCIQTMEQESRKAPPPPLFPTPARSCSASCLEYVATLSLRRCLGVWMVREAFVVSRCVGFWMLREACMLVTCRDILMGGWSRWVGWRTDQWGWGYG